MYLLFITYVFVHFDHCDKTFELMRKETNESNISLILF